MSRETLYSIRMRSSIDGKHVSGAERIVPVDRLRPTIDELVARPAESGHRPDHMSLTVDELDPARVRRIRGLDIVMLDIADPQASRADAARVLEHAGVSPRAARIAIDLLLAGPGPSGTVMRGAMIVDAETGARLEQDRARGVRATRFDWSESGENGIRALLASASLTHFRVREALALASKVAHAPGIVAELCWSDDPGYTAGYVAVRACGYVRFPRLKELGSATGGRAFFVRHEGFDREAFTRYLCEEAVLIDEPGAYRGVLDPELFLASLPK